MRMENEQNIFVVEIADCDEEVREDSLFDRFLNQIPPEEIARSNIDESFKWYKAGYADLDNFYKYLKKVEEAKLSLSQSSVN